MSLLKHLFLYRSKNGQNTSIKALSKMTYQEYHLMVFASLSTAARQGPVSDEAAASQANLLDPHVQLLRMDMFPKSLKRIKISIW